MPCPAQVRRTVTDCRRRRHADVVRRHRSGLDPYDPERVDGYRLTRVAAKRILSMLASLPLAQREQVVGLHPDRAPTIVAGGVILLESMQAFGLESMEVSEHDILGGRRDRGCRRGTISRSLGRKSRTPIRAAPFDVLRPVDNARAESTAEVSLAQGSST